MSQHRDVNPKEKSPTPPRGPTPCDPDLGAAGGYRSSINAGYDVDESFRSKRKGTEVAETQPTRMADPGWDYPSPPAETWDATS